LVCLGEGLLEAAAGVAGLDAEVDPGNALVGVALHAGVVGLLAGADELGAEFVEGLVELLGREAAGGGELGLEAFEIEGRGFLRGGLGLLSGSLRGAGLALLDGRGLPGRGGFRPLGGFDGGRLGGTITRTRGTRRLQEGGVDAGGGLLGRRARGRLALRRSGGARG